MIDRIRNPLPHRLIHVGVHIILHRQHVGSRQPRASAQQMHDPLRAKRVRPVIAHRPRVVVRCDARVRRRQHAPGRIGHRGQIRISDVPHPRLPCIQRIDRHRRNPRPDRVIPRRRRHCHARRIRRCGNLGSSSRSPAPPSTTHRTWCSQASRRRRPLPSRPVSRQSQPRPRELPPPSRGLAFRRLIAFPLIRHRRPGRSRRQHLRRVFRLLRQRPPHRHQPDRVIPDMPVRIRPHQAQRGSAKAGKRLHQRRPVCGEI